MDLEFSFQNFLTAADRVENSISMTNKNNIKGPDIQNELLAFTSLAAQNVLVSNTLAPIQLPACGSNNDVRDCVSMYILKKIRTQEKKKKRLEISI